VPGGFAGSDCGFDPVDVGPEHHHCGGHGPATAEGLGGVAECQCQKRQGPVGEVGGERQPVVGGEGAALRDQGAALVGFSPVGGDDRQDRELVGGEVGLVEVAGELEPFGGRGGRRAPASGPQLRVREPGQQVREAPSAPSARARAAAACVLRWTLDDSKDDDKEERHASAH
jgi:hypothetical protein